MSSLSRTLRLGPLAYQLWHRPLAAVRNSLRHGGPLAMRETERQRREMEAAAAHLPPLPQPGGQPLVVHLLTGRRFAFQTAFCLHSLARHCPVPVQAEIYDDGTLETESTSILTRLSPSVRIHPPAGIHARLDKVLPTSRYPALRERWLNYPNLRKLIDVHLASTGWKLVLDSDLLFFRRPNLLLEWSAMPPNPLHAVDCTESYGYSRPLMEQLAGAPIPPLVNVGICGLRSETLDWDRLEHWCATLIAREKTNYYLEQALVAMQVAGAPSRTIAPAADYLTLPSPAEIATPTAVMHHYVDTAKRGYFRTAWRRTLS